MWMFWWFEFGSYCQKAVETFAPLAHKETLLPLVRTLLSWRSHACEWLSR